MIHMINRWIAAIKQWLVSLANSSKRPPPGPSWEAVRKEGIKPDYFWATEYPVKLTKQYGEVIYVSAFRQYWLTGAQACEYIFKTNHKNYQRTTFYKTRMLPLFGNSLLVNEGPYWKAQRQTALPRYHQPAVKQYFPVITELTCQLIAQWQASHPKKINMLAEMSLLTLKIALQIFSHCALPLKALHKIGAAVKFCQWYSSHSIFIHPLKPTLNNLRFFWHLKQLDKILLAIIDERYQNPTESEDLLNTLINATEPNTNAPCSRATLLAEFKTHIVTGHETTACALTWMWYLLALNPHYKKALEEELERVLQGRTPTWDDLPKLALTKAIILEAFRLYPPIWSVPRTNITKDRIGGFDIPAGSSIMVNLYALHRNAEYWENPDQFYPERFLEHHNHRHPFAYLPFNAGPHTCIANHLATLEATVVVAIMAQKFRFDLPKNLKVRLEPCISLRPRGGIKMHPKPI